MAMEWQHQDVRDRVLVCSRLPQLAPCTCSAHQISSIHRPREFMIRYNSYGASEDHGIDVRASTYISSVQARFILEGRECFVIIFVGSWWTRMSVESALSLNTSRLDYVAGLITT